MEPLIHFHKTFIKGVFSNGYSKSFIKISSQLGCRGNCRRYSGKGCSGNAGATNQAVKSIAIARGYLAPTGIDLICIPAFANVEIDGIERTAIKMIIEPR